MSQRASIGILLLSALATPALAQPPSTDLGTLAIGADLDVDLSIGAGEVVWYRFTIAGTDPDTYLDIDTHGSALAPSNDTEIGLFDSAGNLIANDDDDGDGLRSVLTFGGGCAPRPAFGTGSVYNGRDGTPGAGEYYLSFSGFNSTFANGWTVTSTSTNIGPGHINISYNDTPGPAPGVFLEGCPGGDAGDLPASAAEVTGQAGALNEIRGTIATGDADMFLIDICDAAAFSASTTGTTFDTQLFLFNPDGTGVVMNDDNPAGGLQSLLTNAFVSTNGQYLLAISGYDRDPVDGGGAAIWNDTPFGVERAPDGPGAANPIAGWSGSPSTGAYAIFLTGACFIEGGPPCPGDLDTDGDVDLQDLATLLANFGTTSGGTYAQGDIDGDGDVDLQDLATLLANFGTTC